MLLLLLLSSSFFVVVFVVVVVIVVVVVVVVVVVATLLGAARNPFLLTWIRNRPGTANSDERRQEPLLTPLLSTTSRHRQIWWETPGIPSYS